MNSSSKTLNPSIPNYYNLSAVLHVVCASLFIAVSAQFSIPFWPVPITMQPFALVLVALLYSPRVASIIVMLYLAEAAVGLPVLSNFSGGIMEFVKPKGGYIIGFLPMVFVTSFLGRLFKKSSFNLFVAAVLGTQMAFLFGVPWLSTFIGWEKAFQVGYYPFILKECISCGLAVLSLRIIRRTSYFKLFSNFQ